MEKTAENTTGVMTDDDGWVRVTAASKVESEDPLGVVVNGVDLLLVRLGEDIFAVSNICTHQYARLSEGYLEDDVIECPVHGACFNVRSGKCLGPIAKSDLKRFPIELRDGDVFVRLTP